MLIINYPFIRIWISLQYDDPKIKAFQKLMEDVYTTANTDSQHPFLAALFPKLFHMEEKKKFGSYVKELFGQMIEEHLKTFDEEGKPRVSDEKLEEN